MGWMFHGKCTSKVRLDGKTAIVTGCNTGIGKYTAMDFYKRGARVIMACRSVDKAKETCDWAKETCSKEEGLGELVVMQLDLASMESVRQFADQILKIEKYIHLLVNNAGVMMCPYSLTKDGFEMHFATNHLGHFLLTLLLLPKIIASPPARIINVSSLAHKFCYSMYFEDINMEKSYSAGPAYARSKLANILFTKELDRLLKGTEVNVYCLHPGVVDTELSRHWSLTILPGVTWFYQNIVGYFIKTAEQGAQTTIYCAVDEQCANESGLYYDDCKVSKPSAKAHDLELAKKLWDVSVKMVKLDSYNPFVQHKL